MPARSKAAGKGTAASDNATGNGHGTRLVIVESPAKARTIAGYLGRGYVVESSIGHIRDMPDKAAEIPQKYRSEPWARLGVDVDHDFAALYVVLSNFPIVNVVSPLAFALKIGVLIIGANLLGAGLYLISHAPARPRVRASSRR